MQINVVFGSVSDKHVYEPLCEQLRSIEGLSVHQEVCSAHREPEQLRSFIKEHPCDLVIAGAGLAAHLPGVIASQTSTPVIGIPVSGVLQGLDALLSVLQMPKGMPVLTSGIESVSTVVRFVNWYQKHQAHPPVLYVVASPEAGELVRKFREPLEAINWRFVNHPCEAENLTGLDYQPAVLEVWLVNLGDKNEQREFVERFAQSGDAAHENTCAAIAVPVVLQKEYSGDLRLFSELTGAGALWVGVNNITNVHLSVLKLWPCSVAERVLLWDLKRGSKTGVVA